MRGLLFGPLAIAVLCVLLWSEVSANGASHEIASGVAGPYQYAIGIWPPSPGPGPLHVSILLFAADKPVPEATVRVAAVKDYIRVDPVLGRPEVDPYYHELDIDIPDAGSWTLFVTVQGALGNAEFSAPLVVSSEDSQPAAAARLVFLAAVGAFLMVLLWTAWQRRRKGPLEA